MFHGLNRFLSSLFLIFSFLCVPINAATSSSSTVAVDPMTTDSRHALIKKVRADFTTEVTARKVVLGTSNGSVALVDIAREYLENAVDGPCDYIPDHPNWAIVIRLILLGYGYDQGVAETLKANEAEQLVLNRACSFCSAYLNAQGQELVIRDEDIYGNPAEVSAVIGSLRELVAVVPDDIQVFARENVTKLSYAKLRTFNAWSSHERFWGVAGVLDPKTPGQLRTAFTAFAGSPFGFVTDLTTKLNYAINHMAADPDAQSVVDLAQLSQRILMTLAAGTPGDADGAWVRLNPSNAGEWEIIRKALFLALSVTSNPETSGNTFLSTLYNCGGYFHKKTAPDEIKTYYWRLEAFAKGFSTVWDGLKADQADGAIQAKLAEVLVKAHPNAQYEKNLDECNRVRVASGQAAYQFNIERSPDHAVLMGAYDASMKAIDLAAARREELAAALTLHPKLKHAEAFHTLYPDLINWVTYHEPSARAKALVSGAITMPDLPDGFTPQGVQLLYHGGKWILKALQLNSTGATTAEVVLWEQGESATETFVGELGDSQGLHLFSFAVNGANATIKAISSGYVTRVGGEGAAVTVSNDPELGIIESSAYPLGTNATTTGLNDAAIGIFGSSYLGSRGVLSASRGSIWVEGINSVSLWYPPGFDIRPHNGKSFKFHSLKGHGIEAAKDVVLKSRHIDVPFSSVTAGQDINLLEISQDSARSKLNTHGSLIRAGSTISISQDDWHGETQFAFAGTDGTGMVFNPADATLISARAAIEFGRCLKYTAWYIYFLNEEERDALARGMNVYAAYLDFGQRSPRFNHGAVSLTSIPMR